MNIHVIIPARSGSKRFPNKNIATFLGKPLFTHAINFALKLNFASKIIFTSDSEKYAKIIKKKKILFHPRSNFASMDTSMEEDILFDLKKFYRKNNIKYPDSILWLRPTHPLRCLSSFKKAYNIHRKRKKTVMIVHKTESRLFTSRNGLIYPINTLMKKKSMIRGQDCKPLFKIFSGEFFKFPTIYSKNFLGKKRYFVIAPNETDHDIDKKNDLKNLEIVIRKNYSTYKKFIHLN